MEHRRDSKAAMTILLVEDEASIADMVSDTLTDHGFAVQVMSNGADALNYLVAGLAAEALFTDINLPGSIDGAVLARLAREIRPGLPVVFASGRWSILDELQSLPDAACLPKPYTPTHALSVVERLVASRQ